MIALMSFPAASARPPNVAFHSGDFSALALKIGKESNRPKAMIFGRGRLAA